MLNQIKFHKLDVVVDCGANVGELYLAFQNKNIEISYFGVEPDKDAFFV